MSYPELLDQSLALRAVLAALAGLIAGSFLATALIRWPRGESAARGRSRCDSCLMPLWIAELVPLLSHALQRGRCRHCGARIDPRHLAVELAAATVGLVALAAHPWPLGAVTALFGWWLLLTAMLDLEQQWLPDRLTLPLLPLGLFAAWAGFGPPLLERAIGAAAGWAALFLIASLYRLLRGREGMGGGDPKLLGALGAWVGAWYLPMILLGAGLFGLAALLLMRLRGEAVGATTRLPLGTLMILAAWPVWLMVAAPFLT
ncbi:MAG TPA: prepilin peptidase [Allosphingosinicella sp.]|nr:prepilin peptidase [Allosphingosinicella sp.]